jgi:hypothetical protein
MRRLIVIMDILADDLSFVSIRPTWLKNKGKLR